MAEELVPKLRGMSFPFRRTGASDFVVAENEAAVKANVIFALTTPVGFLPWRPEFGSKLSTLRHNLDTQLLRESARIHIQECLARWCPYVRVLDVRVASERTTRTLKVGLDFQIARNGTITGAIVPVSFVTTAA